MSVQLSPGHSRDGDASELELPRAAETFRDGVRDRVEDVDLESDLSDMDADDMRGIDEEQQLSPRAMAALEERRNRALARRRARRGEVAERGSFFWCASSVCKVGVIALVAWVIYSFFVEAYARGVPELS